MLPGLMVSFLLRCADKLCCLPIRGFFRPTINGNSLARLGRHHHCLNNLRGQLQLLFLVARSLGHDHM